jgi:hypothetical protein
MLLLSVILTVLANAKKNILSTKGLIFRHVSGHVCDCVYVQVHALVNIHVHIHVHSMQYDHKRNRNRNMNTYKGIDIVMGTDSDMDTDKNRDLVKVTETDTCHSTDNYSSKSTEMNPAEFAGDRIGPGVKAVHSGKTIFASFFYIVPILSLALGLDGAKRVE